MRPISPRAWLQYLSVFALLAVLGTFALWYAWYVRERRDELVGRNLRLVEAFGVWPSRSLPPDARWTASSTKKRKGRSRTSTRPRRSWWRGCARCSAIGRSRQSRSPPRHRGRRLAPAPLPKASETTPRGPGPHRARWVCRSPRRPSWSSKRKLKEPTPPQTVPVKVDLSQLLKRERANDADGQPVFADIVLMQRDGRVIAQRDAPGGQLFWLPAPDTDPEAGFERVTTFEAREERFYLFRQVITVEAQALQLVVCGMVPVRALDEVARWLSSTKRLTMGLIVLLATLALPFLRILFDPGPIGSLPRSRVRGRGHRDGGGPDAGDRRPPHEQEASCSTRRTTSSAA